MKWPDTKGNVAYVTWFVFIVFFITIFTPQVVVQDAVATPPFPTDLLGIILFLFDSLSAMVSLSVMNPSIGFIYLAMSSGMLYVLFKEIVPKIVQGMFSNTVTGTVLGVATILSFALALIAILTGLGA